MGDTLNVLVIGDIVGRPGRRSCRMLIPILKREFDIGFVIANGENAAHGSGLTKKITQELFDSGIDIITSGDHIFKNKDIVDYLTTSERILRPLNYHASAPGKGFTIFPNEAEHQIAVINVLGQVFMEGTHDNPFTRINDVLDTIRQETSIIFVDVHAEATSEKIAMGWYLDGRVTAVVGTHTHVQTADECILPKGTAYITDLGMTAAHKSVIGREIEPVLKRFLTTEATPFSIAEEDIRLSGVVIGVDTDTGKAISIQRIQRKLNDI